MAITFDKTGFQKKLEQELKRILEKEGELVLRETQLKLKSDEARASFKADGIVSQLAVETTNILYYQFTGGADFIMDEWGTGSSMDKDNPALDAYRKSIYWNKLRDKDPNFPIMTRDKKLYKDGMYTTVYGTERPAGNRGGINIENSPIGAKLLKEPSHAFKQTIEGLNENEVREWLLMALNRVNIGSFIKIRPKTLVRKVK